MKLKAIRALVYLFVLGVVFLPCPSYAYNFLYIHPTENQPVTWEQGKTIQYWVDPGTMGKYTNEQMRGMIEEAIKIWQAVSTADVPEFEYMGLLPEDVTGENYESYVSLFKCYTDDLDVCESESQKNLQTVFIFDEDNEILNNELCRIGGCSANAGAKVFEGNRDDPQYIKQGVLVIGSAYGQDSARVTEVVGLIVHEMGHILGLAHPSLNQEIYNDGADSQFNDKGNLVATMLDIVIPTFEPDTDRVTLMPDDKVGISVLYPSDTFIDDTGSISGTIFKSDNTEMMHVNVVARNVDDPLCLSYSFLSGRICPENYKSSSLLSSLCFSNEDGIEGEFGNYIVEGVPPGQYTIEVEEIFSDTWGATVAPGLLPDENIYGDSEFWNENDAADEDRTLSTVLTVNAGDEISNIDIILNRSEVIEERVPFIPLNFFIPGLADDCPEEPTINYAELLGIDESSSDDTDDPPEAAPISGGCSLLH